MEELPGWANVSSANVWDATFGRSDFNA
jgi:hypothetical protein